MKFDIKYPNGIPLDDPESSLLKRSAWGTCEICGSPTRWWDVGFDVPVCSETCLSKLNDIFADRMIATTYFRRYT